MRSAHPSIGFRRQNHATRRRNLQSHFFRPALESLESRCLLTGSPLITELMAVNQSTLFNEFLQDYPDWIEIYNPGPNELDLGGWYLTDQKSELHLWQFPPSVILGPEEYQIVFASGLDLDVERPPGELHTTFRLGRSGEYLGLVRPDGTTVVAEYEPTYPPQIPDVSFGLTAKLNDTAFFREPSPGSVNPAVFGSSVFSHDASFYVEPFRVALNQEVLKAPIHYTIDGSVPTEDDPLYDAERILIDHTTTLRAIVGAGCRPDRLYANVSVCGGHCDTTCRSSGLAGNLDGGGWAIHHQRLRFRFGNCGRSSLHRRAE